MRTPQSSHVDPLGPAGPHQEPVTATAPAMVDARRTVVAVRSCTTVESAGAEVLGERGQCGLAFFGADPEAVHGAHDTVPRPTCTA